MERPSSAVVELLDGPLDDPSELAGNLRDLRRINRLLGGVELSRRAIDRLVAERAPGAPDLAIVDVGTGAADIPVALLADAQRRGGRVTVTAIDSRPEVLAAAAVARPGLDDVAGLTLGVADGRSLPYPDAAFDVAHASLVVHHLDHHNATTVLREMARVARLGVIVNDLSPGWPYWAGAWLVGHLLTANRYTRHDAPLSVLRAYTRDEVRGLLSEAGLRPVAEERGFLGHRYAFAAVHR